MNKLISTVIATVIALLILSSTVFVVDQRHFAIVFAIGEMKTIISEPGLHFKLPPPFQNVVFLDKRILTIDSPEADRFITVRARDIDAVGQRVGHGGGYIRPDERLIGQQTGGGPNSTGDVQCVSRIVLASNTNISVS